MSKHLIKIDNPQHVALSVSHAGLDNQYCEAGEAVVLNWQPSSGWGLQEAHYTDEDDNVVAIDLTTKEFTMPAKAITITGTAKRFVVQDWTGVGKKGEAMMVGDNGEPIPNNKVTMSADGDVNAGGNVTAEGYLRLKDVLSGDYYKVEVTNGALVVTAL